MLPATDLVEKAGRGLGKDIYIPFSINGAVKDAQDTNAKGTNTPVYHHR